MEHGSFIGWTGDDDLHSLYRIADLCARVPSIYEPFGLVALEAMALVPVHRRRHRRPARGRPGRERVGLRFRPKRLQLARHAWRERSSPTTRCATASSPRRASTSCASTGPTSPARPPRSTAGCARHGRRAHHRVGADRGAGRRPRPPARACAPIRARAPTAPARDRRAGGERAPRPRCPGSASYTMAHSPTTASSPTATRRARRPRCARRASPGRPPRRLRRASMRGSPARGSSRRRGSRGPRRRPDAGAPSDAHSAPRFQRAAGAGAQAPEPQPRGEPAPGGRDDRVGTDGLGLDTCSTMAQEAHRGPPPCRSWACDPSVHPPPARVPARAVRGAAAGRPRGRGKGKSRGTACTAVAGSLRPSPLRACVRTRKAPRALPSVAARIVVRSKRRRSAPPMVAMMGRAGA